MCQAGRKHLPYSHMVHDLRQTIPAQMHAGCTCRECASVPLTIQTACMQCICTGLCQDVHYAAYMYGLEGNVPLPELVKRGRNLLLCTDKFASVCTIRSGHRRHETSTLILGRHQYHWHQCHVIYIGVAPERERTEQWDPEQNPASKHLHRFHESPHNPIHRPLHAVYQRLAG